MICVPDNKNRNIPEVVFVRRWAVGVLGIWREGVGWERGGSRWVSLSPTWVTAGGCQVSKGGTKGEKGNLVREN
jgi:hypothetical protein